MTQHLNSPWKQPGQLKKKNLPPTVAAHRLSLYTTFVFFRWATQFFHLSYQMKRLKQEGAVCCADCYTVLQTERKRSDCRVVWRNQPYYQTLRGLWRMPLHMCSFDDAEVAHTVGFSCCRYFLCHTLCRQYVLFSHPDNVLYTLCVYNFGAAIIKFPFCIPA